MFSFDKLWIWWKSLVEFLYMYKFEVWDFKILNDRELYKIIKSHGPKESPLSCNLFDLYYELMGSNHQKMNLVPPISQFVFRKRTHNEYLLKKFVDSEFEIGETIWWIRYKSNSWANFRFRFAFRFCYRMNYFAKSQFLVSLRRSFLSKNYRIVILMPTVRILQIPTYTFFITIYCLGT